MLQELGKLAIADKNYFLHERDEKGNLKSKTVEVEKGVEIEIIPLADGELSGLSDPKGIYYHFNPPCQPKNHP